MTMEELDEILVEAIGRLTEEKLAEIMTRYFLMEDINDIRRYIINNMSEYANHQRNLCAHRFDEIKNLIKKPVKLVIVGEAPINSERYFYYAPGSYLTCIKHYLSWDNVGIVQPNPQAGIQHVTYVGNQIPQLQQHLANGMNFYNALADFGILVWDIYEWPLPPVVYQTCHQLLLDNDYVLNQVNQLANENIIDDNTRFVFRYQNLIDRGLANNQSFNGRNFINNNGSPVRLAIREKGYTVLTQEVVDFFEGNNFRTDFQNQF
jgi:hypothetical protein